MESGERQRGSWTAIIRQLAVVVATGADKIDGQFTHVATCNGTIFPIRPVTRRLVRQSPINTIREPSIERVYSCTIAAVIRGQSRLD